MRILILTLCLGLANLALGDSFRVSPESLKQQLSIKALVLVDARPPADYQAGHIPGAINLPEALTYQQKSASGRIVAPDIMQKLLQERGIDRDSPVVVYDAGNLLDASRLFWVLEVYGLSNVKLLSPGYDSWTRQGFPISLDTPNIKPGNYVPTINHRRIASKFATQLATADSRQQIIDARPAEAYRGETSTAKRFGHIPAAINMPIAHNLARNDGIAAFRTLAELQSAYSAVPKDKKIVLYCEIGRQSSVTYLALRELGYDVANYDASWREWGNDLTLPIEK